MNGFVERIRDESKKALTAKERTRFERLVSKAAGNARIFEQKRKKAELDKQLQDLKEERRVASLPKRPMHEELGSVVLPRYVFSWLETSVDGAWTVADVGMLVVMLGAFREPLGCADPGLALHGSSRR